MIKISVAMAAYNGMNYIEEQLQSVLSQLGVDDEVMISVDPSSDDTQSFLEQWAASDSRISVLSGSGNGVVSNFENAVQATTGDLIFLCDQDDVWQKDKVANVVKAFCETEALLVLHNAIIVDKDLQELEPSFFAWRGTRQGYWKNLWKNSYIGCCMAFRKELKELALPFPKAIPMHDQWLGLLAEKRHGVVFLEEPLLYYRRHDANVSGDTHSSVMQMLKWRVSLWKELRKRESVCR